MASTIIEFEGIYGGPQSREVVLRVLKEALALVENTEPYAEIICSGFRIEEEEPAEAQPARHGE
ncbi:MAG: hypothetical protein M3220_21480 [Chloroflexota bacterium]|nr:hypothetical protein [Chloroflexota bacterium]